MRLVNYYIPESIRKTVGGFEHRVVSCFERSTPENLSKQTGEQKETIWGRQHH